jgi:hypothetical protein
LAILGLTVVLLGICANVGLTLFKCPTIANTQTVACYAVTPYKIRQDKEQFNLHSSLFVETLEGIFVPSQYVLQTKNYISLDASI